MGRAGVAVVLARCIAALVVALGASTARGEVLLRDDFAGVNLDTGVWLVPTGPGTFLGRTQLRPTAEGFVFTGGTLRLPLDTYNPSAQQPGDSFFGSEIVSQETFVPDGGLSIRARVRVVAPVPGGLVASLFTFALLPGPVRDEIDVELLSNDLALGRERFLTNVFADDDFSVPGDLEFVSVAGFDPAAWNTYEIQWLPDRVRWLLNGVAVREESGTVPDDPATVRLNLWAPSDTFPDAYDAALQPVATPEANQTFYHEIDFVEVRRLASVPSLSTKGLLGLVLLLVLGRQKQRLSDLSPADECGIRPASRALSASAASALIPPWTRRRGGTTSGGRGRSGGRSMQSRAR
jgi:beta-glucanase (GH16 family)